MSTLRKDYNPSGDISRNLEETLRKNGMDAHLKQDGNNYQLQVVSHDSPVVTYDISRSDALKLMNGGSHASDKKAYNTFVNIVRNDFYVPNNYVHAKNAGSHVNMGLNGYRADMPPLATPPFRRGFDRTELFRPGLPEGQLFRRIDGRIYPNGPMMVAERPGGVMRPGELQSGGAGFYYKGRQQNVQADVLANLGNIEVKPIERQNGQAIPYSERISSPVYFNSKAFQEVMASHGIVIDEQKKTLTIQSSEVPKDIRYKLTDEEFQMLTNNKVKGQDGVSVEARLDIINRIIAADFAGKVTKEMLESRNLVDVKLQPEKEQEILHKRMAVRIEEPNENNGRFPLRDNDLSGTLDREHTVGIVDGRELEKLKESKGWYREQAHGREVAVGAITVEPDHEHTGKYKMTAIIDGERVSHEITQKQYDKFMAVDDYHRMKLFSKVFPEVEMKGNGNGVNVGAAILAALTVGTGVAHAIGGPRPPMPAPEVYMDRFEAHHVYSKPGVIDAATIAAAQFESETASRMPAENESIGMGR
ncbi:MAG: hypothetical protein E7107_04380 [Prevotella sp.]|nr:hypothetical protein [Prevotella sp.]